MSKRDTVVIKTTRLEYVKYGFIKSRLDENKPECFLYGSVLSNEVML